MDCSVGYDKRRDKYGMRKGNTLKVDVVGENTKRRRLIVVKLFLGELVNNNSCEKAEHPRRRKDKIHSVIDALIRDFKTKQAYK